VGVAVAGGSARAEFKGALPAFPGGEGSLAQHCAPRARARSPVASGTTRRRTAGDDCRRRLRLAAAGSAAFGSWIGQHEGPRDKARRAVSCHARAGRRDASERGPAVGATALICYMNIRVAIVEDNDSIRESLALILDG